jgi:putative transposase
MSGWQPPRSSRAQLEERRLAALEWIARGMHKNQEIADHFGVSVHTVFCWKGRLKRNGSLQATVASGPASRLTVEQGEQLRTLLREDAVQYGFRDETWTTRRASEFEVPPSVGPVRLH